MSLAPFLRENARWLIGGFALMFFSSVGQTFFIALFAGEIRGEYALSHGEFGFLYMMATLASAISLVKLGRLVDVWPTARVATLVTACLAIACLLMGVAGNTFVLLVALYLLRLFGQGMMSHTAMTAMGRWFAAGRGRAVSITTTGHQLGEGVLPLLVALALTVFSWRSLWLVAALVLVIVALPLIRHTLAVPRQPSAADTRRNEAGRQWTRAEVLRDRPFWIVITGVLAPAFIGTSVFFHQVHLAVLKGWTITTVAASFSAMSLATITVTLLTGRLIDRFDARRLLPLFLLPLGLACLVLSRAEHAVSMYLFMALLGVSYGMSSAVFGAIWPELYGTRHLGAIRSVVFACMVFASALGPGLTGWLIDAGTGFEQQLACMALWCLGAVIALFSSRHALTRRAKMTPDQALSAIRR